MNLELLYHFSVLAEDLNLSRAAQKLYLTQSTLSRQMSSLEQQLDVRLFERNGRDLQLTPAGAYLREQAPYLLNTFQSLRVELQNIEQGTAQKQLSIITFSLTDSLFNGYLSTFKELYPDVNIRITPAEPSPVLNQLLYADYDVAYTTMMALDALSQNERNQLDFKVVVRGRAVAVVSPKHHLSGRSSVTFQNLEEEQIVTADDPSANQQMKQYFDKIGFHPALLTCGSPRTIRNAVNNQGFVAILIDRVTADLLDICELIRIEDCTLDAKMCLVWKKETAGKAEPFVQISDSQDT